MIQLSTFFSGLGITGGNTQATNFYEFWKGIVMNGDTEINNITEFMTYLGTNRYEFFKSLNSEYPEVIDERSFYSNIDDVRIYDFYTFYTYAGEYFGGTPVTPTPTPTSTNTPTPTPTSTPTPTPSSTGDTDAQAYITAVTNAGGSLTSDEQGAITNFFTGLKSDGLYSLLDRIYPFIGGSESTNKIEMKAPNVNDLVFYGTGWTHNLSGSTALSNINNYADTLFNVGTNGFSSITNDFSFGVIKAATTNTGIAYQGVGTAANYMLVGIDPNVQSLDNYYSAGNKVTTILTPTVLSGGYLNSVWRDSSTTWRTGYKVFGTSSYDGILTGNTVTGTYTRRSGDAFITLNKVNYLNLYPENGRYSFSWIGKYMNATQRNNFIIRITDLLLAFNRNIFTNVAPTPTPTPTSSVTPTPTPTPTPTTPIAKSITNLAFRQDDTGSKTQFEFLGSTGSTTSGLNTLMIASPNNLDITSITYSGYSCTKAIDIYTSDAGFLAIYYVNLPVSVISPTIVIDLASSSEAISVDMRRINNATYTTPVSTYSITGTTTLSTSTPNTISTDRVLFIAGGYGCDGLTFNNGTGIYEPSCFTSTSFISESGYNNSNPTSTFDNTVFRPLGDTIVNYLSAVFR